VVAGRLVIELSQEKQAKTCLAYNCKKKKINSVNASNAVLKTKKIEEKSI
jgi:hypothetical protein